MRRPAWLVDHYTFDHVFAGKWRRFDIVVGDFLAMLN